MVSFSRKSDYALLALAELARSTSQRLSSRQIATTVGVPLPVMTNVLHQLLHHGLLHSTRGSRGGYCLARGATEISLADVIEAVEGPLRLTMCCGEDPSDCESDAERCELETKCRIRAPVQRVQERLKEFLSQVDLAYIAFEQTTVPLGIQERMSGETELAIDNGEKVLGNVP